MTKDEALKLALEALENIKNDPFKFDLKNGIDKAITAIKEALAQPEQKSVAMADYMALTEKYVALKAAQPEQERFLVATIGNWGRVEWVDGVFPSLGDKMYSAPRTWVGLTDEEVEDFVSALWPVGAGAGKLLRAIEAKLKEKNT
jgi:hypothetical protein